MAIAYLSLGSNLGDREGNITRAIELLTEKVRVDRTSSIYETEPMGYREQPKFLNAVCQVTTSLSPRELLVLAKEIESAMGRVSSFPNAPRPMDVDILLYDNQVINTSQLTIPHPRLEERAFVLVPLAELAPELAHPLSGKITKELLNELEGLEGITKWDKKGGDYV